MTKLSLIIPTYRAGGIDVLFGGLKNQTMRDYELILIDDRYNWRKHEVKKYADKLDIPLIHLPGLSPKRTDKPFGLATAWNLGLRHAEGDYVMFGQDFLWLEPDCFERHLRLQKSEWRVTVGYMHHYVAPPLGDLNGKLSVFNSLHEEKPTQLELPDIRFSNVTPVPDDCDLCGVQSRKDFAKFFFHLFNTSYNLMPNATFPLHVCIALNGFDERLDIGHGFQDDNLCFRLNLIGYEFILDKKNVMYHITHPWSRKTFHAKQSLTHYQIAVSIIQGFAGIKAQNSYDLIQERIRVRYERWLNETGGVEKPPKTETYQQLAQQRRINWIAERCKGTANILELGCSNGYVLRKVNGKTGIDINLWVIQQNRVLYPNFFWVHGDVTKKLPFKDNEFDMVLCTEILEHVPFEQASKVIMEALRVAKNKVIITIPNATIPNYNRKYVEAEHHQWACTTDKLHALSLTFITSLWNPPPNYNLTIQYSIGSDFIYFDLQKVPKPPKSEIMKRAEALKKMKEQEAEKLRSINKK